jgi:CHAT domain-containing protein
MLSHYRRSRIHRLFSVLFLSSLMVCLWLGHPSSNGQLTVGTTVIAQTITPEQQVQQGVERFQAGEYQAAITLWNAALTKYQKTNQPTNAAIVQENLARAYQQLGQSEQAIPYWEQVIAYYQQRDDRQQIGRMRTEQAQAYSNLGQPKKAIDLLCSPDRESSCAPDSALQIARTVKDPLGEAAALGSLGDAYRLQGNYTEAIKLLEASLALVQDENAVYRAAVLNSLGNAYISRAQVYYRRANSAEQAGDTEEANRLRELGIAEDTKALQQFQESLKIAQTQADRSSQLRSLLSAIPAYYRTNAANAATQAVQTATTLIENLPDSRIRVYAAIDLTRLLQPIAVGATPSKTQCLQPQVSIKAEGLLKQAVSVAQRLADRRAESFALGELAHLYECREDVQQALRLTEQAQWAADQDLKAKDSLYLWEWQTARLLQAQGKEREAIVAYERAIRTLESIRSDILTANRDVQFDFRDTIEPIYRELVLLKLKQEQPVQAANKSLVTEDNQKNLGSVLDTIDSLKLAELQNYFGNDCVITAAAPTANDDAAKNTTAIINTIVLDEQTAVIVSLPNGQKKFTWIPVEQETLIDEINEFRRELESRRGVFNPKPAQQVYDWLIAPFAEDLNPEQIKTLVFVQDGILRTVPMAALHDGEQFLIQKYAIATTPSLTLTNLAPINRDNLQALAVGLTQPAIVNGQRFRALAFVDQEVKQVTSEIPGSKELLDSEFTRDRLQQELSQSVYPIIHIATHGKFGTDPEDTFVVTGNVVDGSNERLTFNQLDALIRGVARNTAPLELLALTACETAIGDDRSALGLAGVAVQAGAKSAMASLWQVDDAATAKLATDFYDKLLNNTDLTKAKALQAAQINLIEGNMGKEYTRPAYWAAFVLVGNWL